MSDDDTENSSTGSSVTEAPSSSPQGGIMGQLDDYFGISKAGSSCLLYTSDAADDC